MILSLNEPNEIEIIFFLSSNSSYLKFSVTCFSILLITNAETNIDLANNDKNNNANSDKDNDIKGVENIDNPVLSSITTAVNLLEKMKTTSSSTIQSIHEAGAKFKSINGN